MLSMCIYVVISFILLNIALLYGFYIMYHDCYSGCI